MLKLKVSLFNLGLAAFALVLPACNGDDGDADDETETSDEEDDNDESGEGSSSSTTGGTGTSGDDTETGDDTDGSSSTTGTSSSSSGEEGTTADTTDGTEESGSSESTGSTMARIRVVHASADAPAVDIYVAGAAVPVIEDLAYGDASDYLDVPAGDYQFEIRAADADPADPPAFETGELTLAADTTVTAVAAGLLGSTDAADEFRVLPLVENFGATGTDEAIVRVVHAGADAPTVDIDVGNDESPEIEDLERFDSSDSTGAVLPAGQALQVGIWAGALRVTAFTTPELPEGGELFVIATGLVAQPPRVDASFSLLAVGPDGAIGFIRQNPFVYAVHASPDAPDVDICAGGDPLLTTVSYGAMAPIQVPPGEYTLDFFASPSDCMGVPASSQDTPALEAGGSYLALATGELTAEADEPEFQLAAFEEAFSFTTNNDAVLRVIHGASAPAVDVGVVQNDEIADADILVTDLEFPNAADELAVPAATYALGLAAAGGTPPLAPVASFTVDVTANQRAFVVAAGDLTPDGEEEALQLMVVDTTNIPWSIAAVDAN